MQKVMPVVLVLWMWLHISAKPPKHTDLWQPWTEVTKGAAKNNQPIFIDIYTDWCRYCRIMDATTYKNDSVVAYMKKHYQRYKFNAEIKDTITWRNKAFTYSPRYEMHDFAVYLTRGSIVYPTTVIIAPGGQPFYKHGQIEPGEMEMLLKYFVEQNPKKVSLEDYAKAFIPHWK